MDLKNILDLIFRRPKIVICPGCYHPIDLETESEILYQNDLGEQVKVYEGCASELGKENNHV
jgi:hypothetical protein